MFRQPTVELFSFLAVATSFIGFVLGLSDFLYDCKLSTFKASIKIVISTVSLQYILCTLSLKF